MMGVGVGDPEEELLDSFKVFDKNGDGFITEKELRDTLKTLHEEMDPETLNKMIKEADKNGDGRVDYTEFVKIMKHWKSYNQVNFTILPFPATAFRALPLHPVIVLKVDSCSDEIANFFIAIAHCTPSRHGGDVIDPSYVTKW